MSPGRQSANRVLASGVRTVSRLVVAAGRLLPVLAAVAAPAGGAVAGPNVLGSARLVERSYADLTGWRTDRQALAFAAFRRSCDVLAETAAWQATGFPVDALAPACAAALRLPAAPDDAEARAFFEAHFVPYRVEPRGGEGFLTGYFEPEVQGSLQPTERFSTPLLALPDDLVPLDERAVPAHLAGLTAARRTPDGLVPYHDRAAIEDGALGVRARPLVYLDWVDAFFVHVQGSARVRIGPGPKDVVRVAYAGRNGHPYSSLGKLVVAETGIPPEQMTAPALVAWLRANPEAGRRLMRENRSYIFFRRADELDPAAGPLGAGMTQLVPGRSLAVDRTLWPYGLPIWLEAELPEPDSETLRPMRRLFIAQDTGAAIRGPARADIFFGSGAAAGKAAGVVRHAPSAFVVLLPKDSLPLEGGARP